MFVVRTECKQALAYDKSILTEEGEKVWVCKEPDGWVEATSSSAKWSDDPHPDCLTFKTYESAEKFIKKWKGHPWYNTPNGNYEIIEVQRKYKQVDDGYQKK